jgi:1-acyl-sn-glycerol-3-phosphate acyltransferase
MMTEQTVPPPRQPSRVVRLLRPLASLWLLVSRFRIEGQLPSLKKFVIVAAPHKSNWDFPHALAAGLIYGVSITWIGKDALFRWPFGGIMRWLGGIAVDRSQSHNLVEEMAKVIRAADAFQLVITPEGTRKDVVRWKSGFYHIAVAAGVPLVLAFIDYKRRRVGIAGTFEPTGDYDADLAAIQALYAEAADGKR